MPTSLEVPMNDDEIDGGNEEQVQHGDASADDDGAPKEPPTIADQALKLLDTPGVSLFRDALGNPRIKLSDAAGNEVLPLNHPTVRAWFVEELFKLRVIQQAKELKELDLVMLVLEGRTLKGPLS